MNDILKQRLVGALILVALGVIFWPIIFVQPEGTDAAQPRSIPAPPDVSIEPVDAPDSDGLHAVPDPDALTEDFPEKLPRDATTHAEPDSAPESSIPPEQVTAGEVAKPVPQSAGRAPRTEAPEKLEMDSDGVPVAWTLQVATLSSPEKADDLRRRLLALEHKAYIARVQRDGKTLYRVCIGPKFERAEIEHLKVVVDSRFGVSSLVARYVP